jgi:hypothetical protein
LKRLVVVQHDNDSIQITEKEGFTDDSEIILLLETAKLDFHFDMMMAELKAKQER